jgi:hypothetical protein
LLHLFSDVPFFPSFPPPPPSVACLTCYLTSDFFLFQKGVCQAGWLDWANFRLLGSYLFWQSFSEEYRSIPISGLLFSRWKLRITFDKIGLGYFLGDFFTNASGHPAVRPGQETVKKEKSWAPPSLIATCL